ncbi:site-specific integrase [Streptomyces kaniharaensis]|uniref:Site-specific integrase n=1 Tax=Streptomyces kaniharaensis TaxID=212423 RepID=A0A6N7L0X3_9ACTN|nr:site-specific integrase [Streptomyces kaniharaensis]MQS17390.1 site-specific integrase [Streptomyces kaniharaensis]
MAASIDQAIDDDPLSVVVDQIAAVERGLSADRIREVTQTVLPGRTVQRRVAQELRDNAGVLRTGRSPSVWAVGKLLVALTKAGAVQVAVPRCCGCDREIRSLLSRKGGLWACGGCSRAKEECGACGTIGYVISRDRLGRPRCPRCPDDEDPTEELIEAVTGRHPGLERETVERALAGCSTRRAVRRRVAWAVLDQPELLTGVGAQAPTPSALAFINALVDAGATTVVRPGCALCGVADRLRAKRDGQRICWRCDDEARAETCASCGKLRKPGYRNDDGRAVCRDCRANDPISHEPCTGCGHRRRVKARTAQGPWCQQCSPREHRECSVCGQTRRCLTSRATGSPWCRNCRSRHIRCSSCGAVAPLRGGTLRAPLCAPCLNPDPDFWDRCPLCATSWQFGTEPCQRCLVGQRLSELLGHRDDEVPAELEPFRRALAGVERPDHAMGWLAKPKVATLLTALGGDPRSVTHDVLDELPAGKPLNHLRAVLVASGVLPARDERIAQLERWAADQIATRTDPHDRRILHGYAIWHHLRRLRRRLRGQPMTVAQGSNVRVHITAAIQLLEHASNRCGSLNAYTQGELDEFLAHHATYPSRAAHFVRWAVAHRHAHNMKAPATRWAGPSGPYDEDRRWEVARRLLHDDGPPVADRVAGLLLLLYAQTVNTIRHLTVGHVQRDGERLTILFGDRPIVLPAPLDALVEELITHRRGHTLLDVPGTWLFPGRLPGQPLSSSQVVKRLRGLGIKPRQDRGTALFTLAAEIPAVILARTLGIHRSVAVQWQRASGGDWAAYAADVAARPVRTSPPAG